MGKKRTIRTTRVTPEEAARLKKIREALEKEFPPAKKTVTTRTTK
jgi:hypothetical protein